MNNFKDRVTIYEVAKASGVSLATVSRVINKKDNVTEETRKRVEAVIAKLGYKPSALAQGLATNRTTNIAIVLPYSNYVYLSNILSGMVDVGKIYGYQTTLFVTRHNKDDAQSVLEKVITSHVDGAIIFDDEMSKEEIAKLSSYKIPLVVIGHEVFGKSMASIKLNYEAVLKEVIKEQIKDDDSIIHLLHLPEGGMLASSLETSIVEECRANDFKNVEMITIDDSYTKTYNQFRQLFENGERGYFVCQRDSLACALTNAALDSNLRVPEDVEIISIIGTKYSMIARPMISSLNIDMYEVGSIAMRMLTKLLKNDLDKKVFVFDATFTKRGSTK